MSEIYTPPSSNDKRTNSVMEDCLPPGLRGFVGVDYEKELAENVINNTTRESPPVLDDKEEEIFRQALETMNRSGVLYAVGAAFARNFYTGIWRHTKDLDIFIRPVDLRTAMQALEKAGFEAHIEFEHWLAQAFKGGYQVDLIFGTGHGQIPIDDSWFEHSQPGEVAGVQTRLIPVEEMITSDMFVAERRRYDGSEIAHLILATQGKLDWQRVLQLLGDNAGLLVINLLMFDYVYPGHPDYIPKELMVKLFDDVRRRWASGLQDEKAFRGSLLDPFAYTVDLEDWGYEDRRKLEPLVNKKGEAL